MDIDTLTCIIVTIRMKEEHREKKKEKTVEKNPCTEFLRLIYEALIQTHGVQILSVYA
jgi:hypothetical protein